MPAAFSKRVVFRLHGVEVEIPWVIVKGMRHGQMVKEHFEETDLRHMLDQTIWRSCKTMVPTEQVLQEALDDPDHGQRILVLAAALMAKGKKSHPPEEPALSRKP